MYSIWKKKKERKKTHLPLTLQLFFPHSRIFCAPLDNDRSLFAKFPEMDSDPMNTVNDRAFVTQLPLVYNCHFRYPAPISFERKVYKSTFSRGTYIDVSLWNSFSALCLNFTITGVIPHGVLMPKFYFIYQFFNSIFFDLKRV